MSGSERASVRMSVETYEGRHINRQNAAGEARIHRRRTTRRSPRSRPAIETPTNPFGRDGGPDSDPDNDVEEGAQDEEDFFAEGYGHGPLEQGSTSDSSENEDEDPHVHLVLNDGTTLYYMPVARHLLELPLSNEEDSEDDSDDEGPAFETLMRVGAMLEERERQPAVQRPPPVGLPPRSDNTGRAHAEEVQDGRQEERRGAMLFGLMDAMGVERTDHAAQRNAPRRRD